ncbi:MAG: 2Fe-2S iron-sulfur cluster-binding protein [Sideroxyarcus sp.]|nr:2Fe-2S iron-sulfur cluster-binding protein [Sideroxyarcus sp.]
MSHLLSLTRAARLVGVNRVELQKKMKSGELVAFDGMVAFKDLLACYPDAQLEDISEYRRVMQIKERAFGKRVFEHILPDAEVLATRITDLSKRLTQSEAQIRKFNTLLGSIWDKFLETEKQGAGEAGTTIAMLRHWLEQGIAQAMEPGFTNPLAIKDGVLSVLSAQVTLLPSKQDFLVEGQATLLEAALRAGVSLNYGCSGGNCGLCRGRVVSGEVKKTRHHDYPLSETEKGQGVVLLCSNTAVSDVVIEAAVTDGVQDIPFQQISTSLKAKAKLNDEVMLIHLQTPRSQRLRFLAGQSVMLRVGQSYTAELPIASCPCDDRNLLLHVHRQPGNLFSDYVFDKLKNNETVEVEGPQGEFILHGKSGRPLFFIAFDGGFAPIKSLIEHAMSLEAESIHLYWIGSTPEQIYLPNVGRAWDDALDTFRYTGHVSDFDLRVMNTKRETQLHEYLASIRNEQDELVQGDIYLAGPEAAVAVAEQFFLALGLPQSRVFVEAVK